MVRHALWVLALLAYACSARAVALPPRYDSKLPSTVRVCVQAYPPFVMQRNWVSPSLSSLAHPPGFSEPAGLSGVVFTGANVSMLDGFDVAFVSLVLQQVAGVSAVAFLPYPDTSSLYVGLRNGECDFAASAIELDVSRATCGASCPDTSKHPIVELPASDYGTPQYLGRLEATCCLEYGVSYLMSGFALFSVAQHTKPATVVAAILSVDMMNAVSPVIIALLGFATLIWLFEHRANPAHFASPFAALYFAFVCTATFGFGDLAPATRLGRCLTMFWAIFVVFSLAVFGAILSSNLTLNQLVSHPLDTLAQVGDPAQVCVEATYELANRFVADAFNLALNHNVQAQGVMHGSVETCTQAVLDGKVRVYLTDRPLLNWIAFVKLSRSDLYVGPALRSNPLVWAYPSNSPLRPLLDAAVITTLVNGSWVPQINALQSYWFPAGAPAAALATPVLDKGSFGWAIALAVLFIVFAATLEMCPHLLRRKVGTRNDDDHGKATLAANGEVAMQTKAVASSLAPRQAPYVLIEENA